MRWRPRRADPGPIPGKSAIGVEVPKPEPPAGGVAGHPRFRRAKTATHPLEVAWRDIAGRAVMRNLAEIRTSLLGGTGSRRASTPSSLVLLRSTPEQVRLMLIDPSGGARQYNGLQHLVSPVVVDPRGGQTPSNGRSGNGTLYDLLARTACATSPGYNLALPGRHRTVGPPVRKRRMAERRHVHSGADHPPSTPTRDRREPQPPKCCIHMIVVDELNDLIMVGT